MMRWPKSGMLVIVITTLVVTAPRVHAVEYSFEDVLKIFNGYTAVNGAGKCINCHSVAGGLSGSLDLSGNPYSVLVGVASPVYGTQRVKLNDSANSLLFTFVNTAYMPQDGTAPLTAADIASIKNWIDNGCINVMNTLVVTRSTTGSMTAGTTTTVSAKVQSGATAVPKSGITVTWTCASPGYFTSTGNQSATSLTDATGTATIVYRNDTAGTNNNDVKASVVAAGNNAPASNIGQTQLTVFSTVADVANKYLVTLGSSAPYPAGTGITVNVQLADQFNNSVSSSRSVTMSRTGTGGGTFSVSPITLSGSGFGSTTFTPTTAGTSTITATSSTPTITGSASQITTTFGSANNYVVSLSSGPYPADSAVTATATLKDASGNTVTSPAQTVTWSNLGTCGGSFSSTTSNTSSGVATITFTPTTVGSLQVRATTGGVIGTSSSVTTTNGAATKYIVTFASIAPYPAGTAITVNAQLADQHNNSVATSGKTVTWTRSGTGAGNFSNGTSNTDGTGKATIQFTPTTAGTLTVTATDTTPLTGNSAQVNTTNGPATQWLVTPSTTSPSAGAAVNVVVQLADASNNSVPTIGINITLSNSNGTLNATSGTTNASGTGVFSGNAFAILTTSSTAGVVHTVTANGNTFTKTSPNITTVVGTPTKYVLSLSTNPPTVGTTITVTAQLADSGNNAVTGPSASGRNLTFSNTGGGGYVSSSGTTGASGTVTVSFNVANTISTYNFSVTDGTLTGALNNITSLPDVAHHFDVTVSDYNPVAGTGVTVSAQLKDQFNNNRPEIRTLNWNSVSTGGSFTPTQSTTNASGFVTSVTFTTSTVAGTTHTVRAVDSVNTAITGDSAGVLTRFGAPTKYLVTQTSGINPAVAGDTVQLTAQLADVNNNSVTTAGVAVLWSDTTGSGGSFSTGPYSTNASGESIVNFTTSTVSAVTHTLKAETSGTPTTFGTVAVTTKPGAGASFRLTPSAAANAVAGSNVTITAQLVDANNNNVTLEDYLITWSDTTGTGGSFANATTMTSSGAASVVFTTSTVAARIHTAKATAGTLQGSSAAITTIPGPATKYLLSASSTTPVAGTDINVTAQLADVNNNAVSEQNHTVTWSKTGSGGSFGSATSQTNASGIATITFTTSTVSPTIHTVTATDENSKTGTSASVTTQPGAGDHYTLQYGATQVVAGGSVTIFAQLRDQNGNAAPEIGKLVTWSTSNGNPAGFASANSLTNASGLASIQYTVAPTAGTLQTITATDNDSFTGTGGNILTIPAAASKYLLSVSSSTPVAGAQVTITAQLADAFNNSVATANRTVTWTRTGAGGSFVTGTSQTNSSGVATVVFTTSTVVGITYAATGTDGSNITGTSSTFTTQPGAPAGIVVTSSSANPVAGSAITVTAKVVDANGNTVPTQETVLTWSSSATGGSFDNPTSTTDASGIATVQYTTPTTAGAFTLGATDGTFSGSSTTVTSIAGTAAKYVVTTNVASAAVGVNINVTAQLADANGNAVSGSGKTITWSSSPSGTFTTATSTTKSNGSATVSFSSGTANIYTITATDGNGLTGTSGSITIGSVVVGAPIITSSLTASATVGTAFSYTIVATGDPTITYTASPLPAELSLSGDTISGTPAFSGTLTVNLVATNSLGSDSKTLVIVVTSQGGGGGTIVTPDGEFVDADSDGDSVSNFFESLAGTNANDATDAPKKKDALSVDGAKAKLNFTKPGNDNAQLKISFTLPAATDFEGSSVSVAFGALVQNSLTLDAKGKSPKGNSVIAVKRAAPNSSALIVTYTVKKQDLKIALSQNGLVDENMSATELKIPVGASFKSTAGSYVFSGSVKVTYKATKGKSGSASRSSR